MITRIFITGYRGYEISSLIGIPKNKPHIVVSQGVYDKFLTLYKHENADSYNAALNRASRWIDLSIFRSIKNL